MNPNFLKKLKELLENVSKKVERKSFTNCDLYKLFGEEDNLFFELDNIDFSFSKDEKTNTVKANLVIPYWEELENGKSKYYPFALENNIHNAKDLSEYLNKNKFEIWINSEAGLFPYTLKEFEKESLSSNLKFILYNENGQIPHFKDSL